MNKRLIPVAVAAIALLAACGDGAGSSSSANGDLSGQRLVVVNWGGSSGEAMQKGWIDPFSEETGVQVAVDTPPDPAKVRAMVDAGNTTWDVVDFGGATGAAECGKLFDKRPDDFDISAMQEKYVSDDCGVPAFVPPLTVVYNKELYGDNPPTSAEDFMDVEKYPGKRIFLNYADGQVEPLLMVDGLAPDEIYPIDWARVEAAADELGDELTPQDSLTAQIQSLESGDYGMCLCYVGTMAAAGANGADFGVLWDKTFAAWDVLYAVKGSKSPEAQWAFLQYVATPETHAPFYQYSAYSSPLKEAPEVPEDLEPYVMESHEDEINQMYDYDPTWWAENADMANEEWTRIMAG